MFKLRRYLRGHYLECVLAPTFKGLEAILQLIAPLVMAQIIDVGIANRDAGFVVSHGAVLAAIALVCYVVAIVALVKAGEPLWHRPQKRPLPPRAEPATRGR